MFSRGLLSISDTLTVGTITLSSKIGIVPNGSNLTIQSSVVSTSMIWLKKLSEGKQQAMM